MNGVPVTERSKYNCLIYQTTTSFCNTTALAPPEFRFILVPFVLNSIHRCSDLTVIKKFYKNQPASEKERRNFE